MLTRVKIKNNSVQLFTSETKATSAPFSPHPYYYYFSVSDRTEVALKNKINDLK